MTEWFTINYCDIDEEKFMITFITELHKYTISAKEILDGILMKEWEKFYYQETADIKKTFEHMLMYDNKGFINYSVTELCNRYIELFKNPKIETYHFKPCDKTAEKIFTLFDTYEYPNREDVYYWFLQLFKNDYVDLNAVNKIDGNNLLQEAIITRNTLLIDLLLANNVEVYNHKNNKGTTPYETGCNWYREDKFNAKLRYFNKLKE